MSRDEVIDALSKWECRLSSARSACAVARREAAFYTRLLEELDNGVPKENVEGEVAP